MNPIFFAMLMRPWAFFAAPAEPVAPPPPKDEPTV